jgi:hypothetical protein
MKRFLDYLEEKILSIGLNPKHDDYRNTHAQEIHDVMQKSYVAAGGYSGLKSGSKEESDSIHADIKNPNHIIKATRRGDKISAAIIYKKSHGRKLIAAGTNGSSEGKVDFKKHLEADHKLKRAWAEVSGAPEAIMRKIGHPTVPSSEAEKLTGKKDIKIIDRDRYSRKIGDHEHEKTIMGHPKKD